MGEARERRDAARTLASHRLNLSPHSHSLLRLRSARASLARLDTPESSVAVKTATEEIVRNAALLEAARVDLEDVFKRAK
jgi:hypothetical protein